MNTSFKHQEGSINVLLIPLIMSVVLLLAALGFGAWAYTERQDYKDNSDQKAAAAAEVAVERAKSEKDNEFLQREKEPLKTYDSPAQYGSFSFQYPKTWSAYSNEQSSQFTLLMQPDIVSSSAQTPYALKVEVLNNAYNQLVSQQDSGIKQGKIKATTVTLAKVPGVTGLRIDGQVANNKNGAAVFLPLRDKTIKISSESPDKVPDLNNIILPSFKYTP